MKSLEKDWSFHSTSGCVVQVRKVWSMLKVTNIALLVIQLAPFMFVSCEPVKINLRTLCKDVLGNLLALATFFPHAQIRLFQRENILSFQMVIVSRIRRGCRGLPFGDAWAPLESSKDVLGNLLALVLFFLHTDPAIPARNHSLMPNGNGVEN